MKTYKCCVCKNDTKMPYGSKGYSAFASCGKCAVQITNDYNAHNGHDKSGYRARDFPKGKVFGAVFDSTIKRLKIKNKKTIARKKEPKETPKKSITNCYCCNKPCTDYGKDLISVCSGCDNLLKQENDDLDIGEDPSETSWKTDTLTVGLLDELKTRYSFLGSNQCYCCGAACEGKDGYLAVCQTCNKHIGGEGFDSHYILSSNYIDALNALKENLEPKTGLSQCYCCGKECKNWGEAYVNACESCTDEVQGYKTLNGNGYPFGNPCIQKLKNIKRDSFDSKPISSSKEMAGKVLDLIGENGYAFGPWVRDLYLGKENKEIDIFINNAANDFTTSIGNLFKKKNIANSQQYFKKNNTTVYKHKYILIDRKSGLELTVNVHFTDQEDEGEECAEHDHPFHNLKTDIDGLIWNQQIYSYSSYNNLYIYNEKYLDKIFKNIDNKRFVPLIKDADFSYLINEGYKPINTTKETNMATIAKSKLKVGDRILITIKDCYGEKVDREAIVIDAKHRDENCPLVFFLTNDEFDDGSDCSWNIEDDSNSQKYIDILEKNDVDYGFDGAWFMKRGTTVKKIISSAKSADGSEPKPIVERIKSDMVEAGYRVASTQFTKAIKGGILLALKDKGMEEGKIASIKEVLETEFGNAIISSILGYGLGYVPGLKEDPRIQKLADEFRIQGMAAVGNEAMNIAMTYFLPALNDAMNALPELPAAKTRVATGNKESKEEAAEEVVEASKTKSATR